MAAGSQTNGASTLLPKHPPRPTRTGRTTFRQKALPSSVTSFHPSQAQALSPVQFRPLHSAYLPVLLWVLLGGIFFGAVTDFGALYASVKNDGKSIGLLIEKYIGKLGRKLFLLFCWLFTLLVIAAFADMVAGTFNAFTTVDGQVQLSEAARPNGAALAISLLFILFAMVFGVLQKKFNLSGWKATVVGLVCTIAALAIGMALPITAGKDTWTYITFVYIFFAAVLPIWLLKQPRDMMTTYMFISMIVGAVLGLLVAHPTMNLPVYTGFTNEKLGNMFPILFVTVACGAISGFHSLVSSDTSSKTIANEKDMLKVGYGAMVLESLLAVVALCVAGAAASADGTPAAGTPVPGILQRCCRLPGNVRYPALCCPVLHDHVCIRACPDQPGCRCKNRPYELPGAVLR